MPKVSRLSIAPVKSLGLQHPEEIPLERFGVADNRRFYIVDAGGRLYTGADHGQLVRVSAHLDSGRKWLRLAFPDGSFAEGETKTGAEALQTVFWGRNVSGHEVMGPWSGALSAYVGEPLRLLEVDNPGDGNDAHPVSLLSRASTEELARRTKRAEPLDSRRFRMLVEVDGCRPHEEDEWIGGRVRVGEAIIRVVEQDVRCVVATQSPETGTHDFSALKAIASYRSTRPGKGVDFGVYADVETPGRIRVGDAVEPLG